MATITTKQIKREQVQDLTAAETVIHFDFSVGAADGIASGDDINLLEAIPVGAVVSGGLIGHDATLGAGCTLQLRVNGVALGVASTAGAASYVPMSIPDKRSNSLTPSRPVALRVAGGAVAATANIVGYVKLSKGR